MTAVESPSDTVLAVGTFPMAGGEDTVSQALQEDKWIGVLGKVKSKVSPLQARLWPRGSAEV